MSTDAYMFTHLNKPAHVGFQGWLVRDNERISTQFTVWFLRSLV